MCYGQFATFRLTRAYLVHVLHTVEVAHPVFLAPNRYFTGIFNYLHLYLGPDRPDNMLYYPISCCGSRATLPEPHFLLLPTVTCVQSDPCTEITSRNDKNLTLDPYNFVLAGVHTYVELKYTVPLN